MYAVDRGPLTGFPQNPDRDLSEKRGFRIALFLVGHAPLALLLYQFPPAAFIHAYGAVALGLWWAVRSQQPERVAYVAGYVVGAEVLWRMVRAPIFWEFGKYGTVLLFVVALVRLRKLSGPVMPLLYFAMLTPSVALTILNESPEVARQQISFNLSGPLALVVSCWFFSHLKVSAAQLQRLFVVMIGPVIGIAAVTLFATLTNPDLVFTGESNRDVTGGFGPNQVSAALGLGALLAFFCVLNEQLRPALKLLMFGIILLLVSQSALTFSRGGLYNAVGAVIPALFFLLKDARSRLKLLLAGGLLLVVANFVLLPQLDQFTGGALESRFQDVDPTGRTELLTADLSIWFDHPVLGVGPGQAVPYREALQLVAHTEFSRLLSEHGVFGLAALMALLTTGVLSLSRARGDRGKAVAIAMITWSCLFMLNAAMRTVAPSFIFGLASATLLLENRVVPAFAKLQSKPLPAVRYW